jgi:MFS family permease
MGPWVERVGARVAAKTSAIFFAAGLALGGLGLLWQQPLLLFLGLGILGGIGCGIGYIAPVRTLVKWFPERLGMATGFAIMGFGGGAFLGGYANAFLIEQVGVARTLFVLSGVYFTLMMAGAQLLRPPPEAEPGQTTAVTANLTRREAVRTPQFLLLWGILCVNVTAGIGILAQASPMMQDLFGRTPKQAAAVVAVISLFNAGGRLLWSSASDLLGRRTTYLIFFVVQFALFLAFIWFRHGALPHARTAKRPMRKTLDDPKRLQRPGSGSRQARFSGTNRPLRAGRTIGARPFCVKDRLGPCNHLKRLKFQSPWPFC